MAGLPDGDTAPRSSRRHAALATLLRALDVLEWRLTSREHVLGGELAWLWVTLVQLDTVHRCHLDATVVHCITEHAHLWACARGLAAHTPPLPPTLTWTASRLQAGLAHLPERARLSRPQPVRIP
ncbi:hypothetical protein [Streptomyces sp. NPDC005281]|uniref:hypothetical protein n=1 Tax=Streptomyces sp. NPDC005281 TaxID=3155712 RepID=UPI0033AD171C